MRNAGVNEAQAGIKIAGRNINNLRYADNTTLIGRKWRRTNEPLDESERGEWKSWLKTQKTKIMASGTITSWKIDEETVTDFIFLGSKITADDDRSHEIKRCLLLGRKAMTNLDSILKSWEIYWQRSVQSKLWFFQWSCMDVRVGVWRKLSAKELILLNCGVGEDLRVPWTARRSNQSILKEISPGCSLEGLMLKLKLQYFGHLMQRVDSLEKTLMLGGIGGRRRRGWQKMR